MPAHTSLIFILLAVSLLAGCKYHEPAANEPYAMIHPMGSLRIKQIDEDRVIEPGGKYIFRVSPGSHTFHVKNGNADIPEETSGIDIGTIVVEMEEGYTYYLEAQENRVKEDVMFGLAYNRTKSWRLTMKKKEPIKDYKK